MTMEPERGAKDQTEGEAKKKAHRTGQPKQSVEQVEQEQKKTEIPDQLL